ncbi:hypothetical protein DFS33DRAFT_1359075 [Desarmillaria ectypa]|nr:hypothetical protein DFS33DRAFT_1359075 [Desarmillaria ectypa]
MTPLPQELFDAIVDETQNGPENRRKTLLSCSLANKSFLQRTRKHLFHSLLFSTAEQFHNFYQICQTSLVDIPPLVKTLCIDNERMKGLDSDEILPRAISSFTSMKSIHLRCLDWDDLSAATRHALGAHKFHSISFDCCIFKNSALLCAFTSGSSATLCRLSFARSEILTQDYQAFVGAKPEIEHLILYGQGARAFDMHLLLSRSFSPIGFSSLRILDICINTQEHVDSIQTFLDSATTPLEELKVFHLAKDFSGPLDTDWLDISLVLDNVRSLTITLDDYDLPEYSDAVLLEWWTQSIGCCGPESKLEHVTLRVRPNDILGIRAFDAEDLWESFGRALGRAEVKTLLVEVHPTYAQQESSDAIYVRNAIHRRLPWSIMRWGVDARAWIVYLDSPEALDYGSHGAQGPFSSSN